MKAICTTYNETAHGLVLRNNFLHVLEESSLFSFLAGYLPAEKTEYQKNDSYYKKLMNNKDEKEKFARENYFMKKYDEEIFILVVDSSRLKPRK